MQEQDPLTHRIARTLEQAFGPGTTGLTKPTRRPFFERQDRPVVLVVAIGIAALVAAYYMGWRP